MEVHKMMKKSILIILLLLLGIVSFVAAAEVSVNDYDPKPAEAGKAVNVWFKIDNPLNEPQQDIEIEIIPKDGLRLTSGEPARKIVGIIGGRSSQTIQYRLLVNDDAFKGSHAIEVVLYKDNSPVSSDLSIEVTDKDFKEVDLQVGDVESDPSRIKPSDENVKLEVTIQNLGDGVARNVRTELVNLPKGITLSESYSGTELLGNINADATALAKYYVDIEDYVKPGEHKTGIKISYKYKPEEDEDEYILEEKIIPLTLAVKSIPLYEITDVRINPEILTAGDDDVEITITVKNIGEKKGESVRLKAYGKTEQPFEFDKSNDFIASSLDVDETGQGTIKFDIDDDASLQKYFLDIEIKNIVNDEVITYDKKVEIEVSNPKPNNPWKYVIVFAVIIAIVIIVMIVNNRRKRNKPTVKKAIGRYGKSYLDKKR